MVPLSELRNKNQQDNMAALRSGGLDVDPAVVELNATLGYAALKKKAAKRTLSPVQKRDHPKRTRKYVSHTASETEDDSDTTPHSESAHSDDDDDDFTPNATEDSDIESTAESTFDDSPILAKKLKISECTASKDDISDVDSEEIHNLKDTDFENTTSGDEGNDDLNSSTDSTITVAQCLGKQDETHSISIMRLEDYPTKVYPCGLCDDKDKMICNLPDHYYVVHPNMALVMQAREQLEIMKDKDASAEAKQIAKREKTRIQNTLLHTSVFRHNQRVLRQRKGKKLFHYLKTS
jgi:hypothetical protein